VPRYRVYILMKNEKMEKYTIGQLVKKANVNMETIRYYERRGLIPEPPRNESGYRQYSQDDVVRTRFVKSAQRLGFSLKEISELLSLRVEQDMTCGDVKARVEAKIEQIEDKISSLQKMKEALFGISQKCTGKGPVSHCPILEELENPKFKEAEKYAKA
jgi:MerR family mercuric resistance operon transcriptional regulator